MDREIELFHVNTEGRKVGERDRNEGQELKNKQNSAVIF